MTFLWAVVILAVVAAAALALATSVHTVRQYERGVVLRYGRLLTRVRQPGLTFLLPFRIDRLTLVNTQIVTMSVPAQDGITRDNVSVTVDAVVYFRVVDPGEGRGQRPEIPLRGVPGGADLAAVGHRAA